MTSSNKYMRKFMKEYRARKEPKKPDICKDCIKCDYCEDWLPSRKTCDSYRKGIDKTETTDIDGITTL